MPKARKKKAGRPLRALELSVEERETLERYARRGTTSQRLAMRAKIVLECAKGSANKVVAQRVRCSAASVGRWRARFLKGRLDGLTTQSPAYLRQLLIRIAPLKQVVDALQVLGGLPAMGQDGLVPRPR